MEPAKEVRLESRMDLDFMDEVYKIPGGEKIKDCIQCGNCSGSCPTSYIMDYTPRQMFAMIRAGMRNSVLSSDTIWLCSSCYTCAVRCPREIPITDLMYILKQMAMRDKMTKPKLGGPILSRIFADTIRRFGRNHETRLMTEFLLATKPSKIFRYTPLGLKLMKRGRMPLIPHKIRGIKQLRAIIKKAEELGGE